MLSFKYFIFFAGIFLCCAPTTPSELTSRYHVVNLVPYLEEQLQNLNPDQPFVHFDLGLSDVHKKTLQALKLDKQGSYNTFDNFEKIVPELTAFLKSLGNNDTVAATTAQIVYDMVAQILQTLNQESAWIAVRCFKKQDTFKVHRWHTDGETPKIHAIGCKYKIVCTLKGPGTIFCNVSDTLRQDFNTIRKQGDVNDPATKQQLCKLLQSLTIQQAQAHEATMFLISDYAAIHSEPDIVQDRLYVGILPGTKEQIQKMQG